MSFRTKLQRMIEYAEMLEKNQRSDPKAVERGWPDVDSVEFQLARGRLNRAMWAIEDAFDKGEEEAQAFKKRFKLP